MSTTPPPPDRPTERLQPTPPPSHTYERVGVPVAADPNFLFVRLEDTIGSLRTALVFVGVIAVLALGVAVYALLKDDTASRATGGGASARITRLNDRVDRLSRQLQTLRSSASALSSRVDTLSRSVAALRTQAAGATAAPAATKAIQDLGKRIDDLEAGPEPQQPESDDAVGARGHDKGVCLSSAAHSLRACGNCVSAVAHVRRTPAGSFDRPNL